MCTKCQSVGEVVIRVRAWQGDKAPRHHGTTAETRHNITWQHVAHVTTPPPVSARLGDVFSFWSVYFLIYTAQVNLYDQHGSGDVYRSPVDALGPSGHPRSPGPFFWQWCLSQRYALAPCKIAWLTARSRQQPYHAGDHSEAGQPQ